MKKTKIFIWADALTKSGGGIKNVTENIVRGFEKDNGFNERYELKKIHGNLFWRAIMKFDIALPLDLFFGKGIYIFPDFRNFRLIYSKSITIVHDVAHKIFPEFTDAKNLQMLNKMLPRYMDRTDKIIAVSQSSKNDILNYFPDIKPNKITVVHNSVDLNVFKKYSQKEVQAYLQKNNFPEKYFLFLSTVEPRKNIDTLLDALGNNELVLIGKNGWKSEEVVEKIENSKNIIWLQKQFSEYELALIMNGATALIHPAWHEGFGLAPLQSIACETPAVVSDISAMREVLGKAGIYYGKPDDTKGLQKTLQNIPEIAGSVLRKRAEGFGREKMTGQITDIISSLD